MPEQIRCPSCQAALRVPDTLLGENVKCPKCQNTFLAEMEESAPPQGIVRERSSSSSSGRRAPPPDDDEEGEYEEPPLEDEEEADRPRQRRRRRRGRSAQAKSLVSGPAIALLVVGIIDIVSGILLPLVVSLMGVAAAAGRRDGRGSNDIVETTVIYVINGIANIIMGSLITMGAVRMKKLTSYGFSMTACILAMMPCVNCCLLGLPFGIWGLVVLNKPEVKDAFQ